MFITKVGTAVALCATIALANNLETGVASLLKKKANIDVKVVKTIDVSGCLKFVVVQAPDGMQFPVLATSNGDTVTAFSREFVTSNESASKNISSALEAMAGANKKVSDKEAPKLLTMVPANGILKLDAGKSKTIVAVTDPECPYCRKELETIDAKLKDANVYLILAPVHGKSAFVKSELIYQKAGKAKTNEEKIKIIKEYFNPDVKLTPKEMEIKPVITEKNAEVVFSSGIVQGVPFVFEVTK